SGGVAGRQLAEERPACRRVGSERDDGAAPYVVLGRQRGAGEQVVAADSHRAAEPVAGLRGGVEELGGEREGAAALLEQVRRALLHGRAVREERADEHTLARHGDGLADPPDAVEGVRARLALLLLAPWAAREPQQHRAPEPAGAR